MDNGASSSPILVTGGTGTLGKHLVPRLRDTGREVRLLSRKSRESADGIEYVTGDLVKGEGIESAVKGVEIILHCAGGPKGDDVATQNLVKAASAAGVKHLIYISVIGCDKLPIGYFKAKHGAEQAIIDSGVPHTILRAAQFHTFVLDIGQKMAKMPMVPVPSAIRFQPVDAAEVADRLVELTLGKPQGMVADIAGPKVYPMADLVRSYLQAVGKRRWIVGAPLPGKPGKAYKAGDNLSFGGTVGKRTWEDFLAEHVSQ